MAGLQLAPLPSGEATECPGSKFQVWGLGFRVLGFKFLGFGFRVLGFKFLGLGFRVLGIRVIVKGLGFVGFIGFIGFIGLKVYRVYRGYRVSGLGLGFRVCGLGFWVPGLGFGVQGLGSCCRSLVRVSQNHCYPLGGPYNMDYR